MVEICADRGFHPSTQEAQEIGRRAARLYRAKFGKASPNHVDQRINGSKRKVTAYGPEGWPIVNTAIAQIFQEWEQTTSAVETTGKDTFVQGNLLASPEKDDDDDKEDLPS